VTITVLHPKAPLGRVWLPLPSLSLWAAALLCGLGLCCVPTRKWRQWLPDAPVKPRQAGWSLIRTAQALLWSGSFVLCDISVPGEKLRVRVRAI
jgi:hypothetical protein